MNNSLAEWEIIRENIQKPDFSFKIVIIGDSGVGKSCLSIKAANESFDTHSQSTIGFDFFQLNVKTNQKLIISLKVWDTCGQERYRSLISSFYDKSSLAIIMYSIDNRKSFEAISDWIKQLKTHSSPGCKVVLIASKRDLEENRVVSIEEGTACQQNYQFEFFMETSSKTGFNVEELFKKIAFYLYNEQVSNSNQTIDPDLLNIIQLSKNPKASSNNNNCCSGKKKK